MSEEVLDRTRASGAAGAARTGESGDPADGVGRVVGQAGRRRRICRAHRRQSSGRRLGRQARRRGHVVRRPDRRASRRSPARSTSRSRSTSSPATARSPQRLIDGLLAAGAVGLNIEDTVHKEGKRLRSAEEHAALVGELRKAADAAGVHVVINARTDLFLRQDGDEADRVDRAIARLKLAAEAGADSLYPVGRHDPDTMRRLDVRAAAAGQRDRAAGPGRPGVVRPARRRPDQLRSVLAAGAVGAGPRRSWPAGARHGRFRGRFTIRP